MKKITRNQTLLFFLTTFFVFTMFITNSVKAADTGTNVTGLERIGEISDPSKPVADKVVLAVIGDYGDCANNCEHEQKVADMVHSWNPDAILTTGDNSYRLGTVNEVELDQKPYWEDIKAGKFFPIYGNHDYGQGCSADSIKPSLDYFKKPVSYVTGFGNGLADFINPDVNCNMSSDTGGLPPIFNQYKNTVDQSTAKWILVGGHQPIFSSGQSGNNLNRRWLLTPGVDLVLQGHDHHAEHIMTPDGYNEVISGNGGQGLTPLFPHVPGSMFRDNSEYGAVKLTITPETMTVDFYNIPGTLVYSFTMKKDPFTKQSYVSSRTNWTDPNPGPGGPPPTGARTVSMAFGEDNEYKNGLDWIHYESGLAHEIELDGRTVLQIDRSPFGTTNNLYMQIQDERIFGGPYHATVSIEYRSPVSGSFVLQYENPVTGSAYYSSQRVYITDAQVNTWQTATLDLPTASFTNRENGNSDIRIVAANKLPLIIGSIKLDAVPVNPPVSLWAIRFQDIEPLEEGQTAKTVVSGIYSDYSNSPITSGITFTSSNPEIASIDPTSGIITANKPGDVVITATYNGMEARYHVVVKDTKPPVTTLQLHGTVLSNGFYLHKATVQLSATDDYSGVDKTEYSLDHGNTWNLYTGPFEISQDRDNEVEYRSIDKAGNVESTQTKTIKVMSATFSNLKELVKEEPITQQGVEESINSHIDAIEKDFQKAAAFLDRGDSVQAEHFKNDGYDSLKRLKDKIGQYPENQLNTSIKKELQTYIDYMINNKTVY